MYTHRFLLAFLGGALVLGAATLGAQATRTITFDDALRIALDQSNVIRSARYAVDAQDANVRASRAQLLPNLSFSTQGSQTYGRNFSSEVGGIINTTTQSFNTGLSSNVTLFNGMATVSNINSAKLNRSASEYDLARSRETVVFTVLSDYLSLIAQQEQLRVQRQNLAAQDTLERQVQEFVNAGTRSIADLYQQQASVANARLTVVQAERSVDLAKIALIQALKLDPAGTYDFAVPPLDSAPPASRAMDMPTMLARAMQQRRDVDAATTRVQASESGIKAAGASAWPSISLSAGYNSNFTSNNKSAFLDQLDARRGGSIGLSLSFPIFDRFSSRIATQRAEIQQRNADLALDDLRQQVGVQVRTSLLDYVSAQAQLDAAQVQSRAAELALDASIERYRAGAATLVEVTQSRATNVQAASALVSARYNLLFQGKLLDYYLGDLDPQNVKLN